MSIKALAGLFLCVSSTFTIEAQPGRISTWAGMYPGLGPAARTPLVGPGHIALESNGNVLVAAAFAVHRITPEGMMSTTFRGSGVWCGDISDVTGAHSFAPFGFGITAAKDGTLFLSGRSKLAKVERAVETGSWPPQMIDTRAIIAGQPVPLRLVSDGRLEAMVPQGVPENTRHQLVVQRARVYSAPEEVLITPSVPAVLTVDGSGWNQGQVYVQEADGGLFLADSAHPALPGQTIILMAHGLGAVTPAVMAGERGPLDPLAVVSRPVKLIVEGQEAEIYYVVMEPGQVGLYRVAFKMPGGVKAAAAARITLSLNGVESGVATLSVWEANPEQ